MNSYQPLSLQQLLTVILFFLFIASSLRTYLGQRPTIESDWPALVCTIIQDCWAGNPLDRPSVRDVRASLELERANLEQAFVDQQNRIPQQQMELQSLQQRQHANGYLLLGDLQKEKAPVGAVTFVFTDVCGAAKVWYSDERVRNDDAINAVMGSRSAPHGSFS